LVGIELAVFTSEARSLLTSPGRVWSVENPRASRLFEFVPIHRLLLLPHVSFVYWDMCCYASPAKKHDCSADQLSSASTSHCSVRTRSRCTTPGLDAQQAQRPRAPSAIRHVATPRTSSRPCAMLFAGKRVPVSAELTSRRATLLRPATTLLAVASAKRRELSSGTTVPSSAGTATSRRKCFDGTTHVELARRRATKLRRRQLAVQVNKTRRASARSRTLSAASKPERFLQDSRVKAPTLNKYRQAVDTFKRFANESHLPLDSPDAVDYAMNIFLHRHFKKGEPASFGRLHIFAYQFFHSRGPDRLYLPESKKALKGWLARCPERMREPVDESILYLLGIEMIRQGRPLAAAALALHLDTYVRPGVLVTLTTDHLWPPVPDAGPPFDRYFALDLSPQHLMIPTKQGKFDDSILVADKAHSFLNVILARLYRDAAGGLLFPGLSLMAYEQAFTRAAAALSLSHLRICPHVVRHSGASCDRFYNRRTLLEIKKRGCWQSDRSVTRYEKEALLLKSLNRLDACQQRSARLARVNFPDLLKSAILSG